MSISGVNTSTALMVQQLKNLRTQLDDLQRQLATGEKVDTYQGISSQAQLIVGLNSQLTAVSSYQDTNNVLNARLSIAQSVLTQFDTVTTSVRNSAQMSTFLASANGQTADQTYASAQLDQLLNLLNTQADGRYMFSGAAVNQPSVASTDAIINGNGNQAGLKQIISERNQADLGVNGLGRLVVPPMDVARLGGVGGSVAPDGPAVVTGTTSLAPPYASAGGTLVINGQSITIPANANSAGVLDAINKAGAGVTATIDATGHLVLTSADATTSAAVGGASTPALLAELGLGVAPNPPVNILTQNKAQAGDSITLTVGANPPLTLTFGPGQIQTLAQLETALNGLVGGTASVDANGNISVTATNASDSIAISAAGPGALTTPGNFGLTPPALPRSVNPPAAGTGTEVSLSEDAFGSPFGFKLVSDSSNLTGVTVSQVSGTPKQIDINVTGTPNVGESLQINVSMPDGTTSQVVLTATNDVPPPPNQFTIGATPQQTAANIRSALIGSLGKLAGTELTAASAITAARNFFDVDATHPPQRVAGPPFGTATALQNGTTADTVSWYLGNMGSNPRTSVTARIDSASTVGYGMQGNEQALRTVIENVAVFAATTFPVGGANSSAAYVALSRRVGTNLNPQPGDGTQKTSDIETDLANVQTSIKTITTQQQQTQVTLQNFVQGVTGVSNEEVGSEIMALQVQLQASLQTTAMLSKLTLTNYIS